MNKTISKASEISHHGFKYLIISSIAFSLMTVCVKNIHGRLPVSELVLSRALISLAITRYCLYKQNISPWGFNRKLLLIRGLLGTSALFFIFKAIDLLPLASATIIQYTYPAFTSLAAWIFLKEKLNKSIILSLLMGWFGIVFIAQPSWLLNDGVSLEIQALLIALCGAIFTALAYICVRKLSKTEHPLVIIHYFPLLSLPITIPLVINKGVIPIGIEWLWLIGIGVFTQIGQIGITKGLSLLPAAKASSINYTQVLFATIWGIIIFAEPINKYIAIGGLFIFASTVISVSTKPKII